jgi:hypothetical protein
VVEKEVRAYLENNPDDTEAKESLTALEEARPRRIEFEELDFNLGERWIPTGIYARFASHLFDADVRVHYSESSDDFSVKCHQGICIFGKNMLSKRKAERLTVLPCSNTPLSIPRLILPKNNGRRPRGKGTGYGSHTNGEHQD